MSKLSDRIHNILACESAVLDPEDAEALTEVIMRDPLIAVADKLLSDAIEALDRLLAQLADDSASTKVSVPAALAFVALKSALAAATGNES